MPQFHTFLSYSHSDHRRAKVVHEHLQKAGFSVWRDSNLRLGDRFKSKIIGAIAEAESVTALLTEQGIASDAVYDEAKYALRNGKKLIPVILSPRSLRSSKRWRSLLDEINWGPVGPERPDRNLTQAILRDIEHALKHQDDRGCPVLCFYHFKGGVGKTTLAAHVAAQLYLGARQPKSVLMIDCDAQSNLSSLFLSRKQIKRCATSSSNLIGLLEPDRLRSEPGQYSEFQFAGGVVDENVAYKASTILHHNNRADKTFAIVPNCIDATKYSKSQNQTQVGQYFQNFQQAIQYLSYSYDYIVLDCNPSATMLSEFALQAATDIVLPIRLDKFALDGLENLDTLMQDFYSLGISHGAGPSQRQIWTVVNMARLDRINEPNAVRARGQDEEALQLRPLVYGELEGGRKIDQFIPTLLDSRIPQSGHLQPRAAATAPHGGGINAAERLLAFKNRTDTSRVATALMRLAKELSEKSRSTETVVTI